MKQYLHYFLSGKIIAGCIVPLAFIVLFVITGCERKFSDARYDDTDELQIMDFIDQEAQLSTFKELIDYVNRRSLLKTAGAYTLFAPTNEAFERLFARLSTNGDQVTSITDRSPEFWLNYFSYHLLDRKINTNVFIPGPLPAPTVLNDKYLIADIRGSYSSIKLNNLVTIVQSNIELTNGYVNITDEVLSPPIESIYDVLHKTGMYTIMLDIFEETGLTSYLKDSTITLIIERDEVLLKNNFDKNSIPNLEDWAGYHVIPDSGYFLNQLANDGRFYPLYKRESLSFSVDDRDNYFMNEIFQFDQSLEHGIDRVCFNGIFHSIDTVVDIVEALPSFIRYNLYPPGSPYGEQNVFTESPARIVMNDGTKSYHQNQEGRIVAFDAQQVGDSFHLTIPEVPAGMYDIRLVHRNGTRGKFITIYDGEIIKADIDLAVRDGVWEVWDYYIVNNCGRIDVQDRSDVTITFAFTGFATGKLGNYCCDILMDAIELIPVVN
ncbi:fasciclin domain-containing protein [Sphingobacterium sp. SGG-5]|uniref:fasciclin domain-containing protein n=1 Tax=Sphingobacterium sp. SGG-5 TaxID=2710881 RepID=UPI0013EBF988|nr:fasciclin domain-containing protein [Sphingobacterium sp. SGG-5]NGM61212.1 fasciclin domain-containing protein [Sphingobacterium sp. SGG-5]